MCVLKRAFLYVSRKWQQSLILFLVLLVASTSALTGFAVLKASDTAAVNLRRQFGGTFKLEIDTGNSANYQKNAFANDQYSASYYSGDFIEYDDIDEIMKVPGISEYSASCEGVANLKSGHGKYYDLVENEQNHYTSFNSFNPHTARIQGWTSPGQCPYFAGHFLELAQGELFTADGSGQAVISRELAELNHIQIGDELTLEINRDVVGFEIPVEKQLCAFEVTGIFDICGEQQINQFTLPRQMMQNWVFVDCRTLLSFMNGCAESLGEHIGYEEVTFSVDDPAEMDSVIRSIQEKDAINWNCFKITIDNTDYQSAEHALKSMDSGIRIMIFAIAAAGVGILVLLLGIWTKFRIHETGILLSVGRGKGEILAQRMVESLLIAGLAITVSWACSGMAANRVGNRLLAQANAQIEEEAMEETPVSAQSFDIAPVFSPPEVEELTVAPSADIFAPVCVLELLAVLSSVGLAELSIIKMKPKAILNKYE